MDTNLKKGKKIRAFCYRIFALGALIIMLTSAITGWDAIRAFVSDGTCVLSGNFYELPEFKEYIGELCYQTLLTYAGVGDSNGRRLSDTFKSSSARVYADTKTFLHVNLQKSDQMIQYYIKQPGEMINTNMPYAALSTIQEEVMITLPADTILCYFWDGAQNAQGSDLHNGLKYIHAYRSTMSYQPLTVELNQMRVIIAVKIRDYQEGSFLYDLQLLAQNYRLVLLCFFISGLVFVLSLPFCLFSRKAYKAATRSYAALTGKILVEFKIAVIALSLLPLFYYGFSLKDFSTLSLTECLRQILFFLPFILLLFLLYTDIRHNKFKFFLHSLPGRFVIYIKELWRSTSWYRQSMLISLTLMACAVISLITGICLITTNLSALYQARNHYRGTLASELIKQSLYGFLFVIVFLFLISLSLFKAYRYTRKLSKETNAVAGKLAGIKDGTGSAPLVLPKNAFLTKTAADINELEDGIEKMAEQKNRSNKLRVELLTNVSHDLKTPLTSIINYADLLCEEPLEEKAADYAASLRTKAYRLKSMVQDVFEFSKAASGNLSVEKRTIDLVKLVRQTLADMEERIQESSLTFKTVISEEPMLIEADGDKLYRVFQNLFVNALQYSLENSRVYVMLSVKEEKAYAKIKNTSKWELDFDTKDIMERFVRADASRTTEGSGLGLSIVQSFTELCGGSFSIETDADMFTACVAFPLVEKSLTA